MFAFSAAHRTMPIPSWALVRNPANGRELVVRINDRGPFHADRIIDLSYAAALRLDLQRGVAPVEVRRLTHDDIRSARWRGVPQAPDDFAAADADAPAATAADKQPAGDWWLQLGAFRQREGAHELRQALVRELAWLEPWLAIFDERALFRVQAGPYASRAEALGTAERIRDAAALQPLVLQRR
jgi:rare lipoprotein A